MSTINHSLVLANYLESTYPSPLFELYKTTSCDSKQEKKKELKTTAPSSSILQPHPPYPFPPFLSVHPKHFNTPKNSKTQNPPNRHHLLPSTLLLKPTLMLKLQKP